MTNECLFCRIANGKLPVELVYEDDLVAAFKDIKPQAPTHILIVPKAHIQDVMALANEPEIAARLMKTAADLASREGLVEYGFRVVINNGEAAGQTVPHLHIHLLGGRELTWPPG